MASFEKVHSVFLEHHKRIRRGERARRLEEGHGHAERMFLQQVWRSAFGQFEQLHPEYEVNDFRDGGLKNRLIPAPLALVGVPHQT